MSLAISSLHIGMKVPRHPSYGVGVVKSLTEHTADIIFDDQQRTIAPETSDLTSAETTAVVTELQLPLDVLIRQTAQAVVDALNFEPPDTIVEGLGSRWQNGTFVLQPGDTALQAKEVPLKPSFTRS